MEAAALKKRLLFVSNSLPEQQQVRDFLADRSQDWELVFHTSAANAANELRAQTCDVVVSDMTLPDQEGLELLENIQRQHPKTATIILGNLEDGAAWLKCIGTAHQFLGKPCDANHLKAVLDRALDADGWMPDMAVRRLAREMKHLPSPPNLYFRALKATENPEHALENIGWLIARDPAMTAKLLQLVNSASLGLALKVTNPIEAVMHLGLNMTKSVLLLAHTCTFLEKMKDCKFAVDQLWHHSTRAGYHARSIARSEKANVSLQDESFTAGLLHDIGKLALAANRTKSFSDALTLMEGKGLSELEAERTVFGTTHAEVGAYLLATWGLPWPIVEAVALHHSPGRNTKRQFCALTAVHVADVIDHIATGSKKDCQVDDHYLKHLGLSARFKAWKSLCLDHDDF